MLFLAEKAKDLWDKLRRCFCNAVSRRRDKKSGQAAKKNDSMEIRTSNVFYFTILRKKKVCTKKIIFFCIIKLIITYLGLQAI